MIIDMKYAEPARSYEKQRAMYRLEHGILTARDDLKRVGHEIGAKMARHRKALDRPLTLEEKLAMVRDGTVGFGFGYAFMASCMDSIMGSWFGARFDEVQEEFNSGRWRVPPFGKFDSSVAMNCYGMVQERRGNENKPLFYAHHFLHVSTVDPQQVAFYQSIEHMMQSRETRCKPGRYLTRFFGEIFPQCEMKAWVEHFMKEQAPVNVKFARTKDEIIRAIAEGSDDSCMSNKYHCNKRTDYSYWSGHVHPAAVYAASGDIEVGYIENDAGEVTARVVCNARTMKMARCYGDANRLLPAMQALGYVEERGALVGCRLEVIDNKNGDGWIMPYVDAGTRSGGGCLSVSRKGEWWVLGSDGDYSTMAGYENNGVLREQSGEQCDDCGDMVDEDDMVYVDYHERNVCQNCAERNYVSAYGRRMDQVLVAIDSPDVIYCESDGEYYLVRYAADNNLVQDEDTQDWYSIDDLVGTSRGLIHVDCAARLDVEDSDGNDFAHKDDTVTTCDGRLIHENDAVTLDDGRVIHENDNEEDYRDEAPEELEAQAVKTQMALAL
jgi:hypothetical protein